MNKDPKRTGHRIKIEIEGFGEEPDITLRQLVKALGGVQKCFSQSAEYHKKGAIKTKGRYEKLVAELAELYIVKLSSSVPMVEVETRPGPPDLFDTAEQVYGTVKNWLVLAATKPTIEKAKGLIPDESLMTQLLEATQDVFPSAGQEYKARIAFEDEPIISFDIHGRDRIAALASGFEEAVTPEVIEEEVIVTGLARITFPEKLRFKKVYEIEMATPEGVFIVRTKHREFHLYGGITPKVYMKSGLWLWEYESLGIIAHGESRDEAREAFYNEFAFLWDTYADADDKELTEDARELKRKLRELVSEVKGAING